MAGKIQADTPARWHTISAYRTAGLKMPEVAARLGITPAAAAQCFALYRHAPPPVPEGWTPPTDLPVPVTPAAPPDPVALESARLEQRRRLREDRDLLTAVAGERSMRAFLEQLIRETSERFPPPPAYRAPKAGQARTTETMLMQWSDWHAYEIVSAERTRGFGEYDARIFGQRVKRIVDAHVSIKTRMERGGGWRFPELVIAANGDFVSGTIHEVERHGDAPNVVLAVYGCARVMAQALRDLAAHYETVRVYCTSGNHGRLPDARRIQQKDPLRSWDTLIYLLAKESLADCPNVEILIPDSYSVAFDVQGWRFLQTHGHDVKSWNSIPFYGINRYVSNINALEAARDSTVQYFLFGHFHNKTSLEHASGEYFVNGSLIGGTEFGLNALGRIDKPCQWMLAIHPEHGVTHRWPLTAIVEPDAPGYEVQPWLGTHAE